MTGFKILLYVRNLKKYLGFNCEIKYLDSFETFRKVEF